MTSRRRVVFLQLNELNFDYVEHYADRGLLPNFRGLFETHGYCRTTSESEHHLANPWIQWPTVHTGLRYADHGVFRLGDIVKTDHPTIYETLERHGLTVAALGAFNARNDTSRSPFFVPDPWTHTRADGPASVLRIHRALQQITDDYAAGRISFRSLVDLVFGAVANARLRRAPAYLREALRYARGRTWYRAIVCDRLLADVFLTQWRRFAPDYSTLFLNGAAHLQHHYLYSSAAYPGPRTNPAWHVPPDADPLLDILKTYDDLLGDLLALAQEEDLRVLIASGLHQEPHERETYYYRIDDQGRLLERLGLRFVSQYNLMTEDFVVCFADPEAARAGEEALCAVVADRQDVFYVETADRADRTARTSASVFHTENRGRDIYVQLKPTACTIPAGMTLRCGANVVPGFDELVSFAQYKNTHHHGDGFLTDTARMRNALPESFPLEGLFGVVLEAFGIPDERPARRRQPDQETPEPVLEPVRRGRPEPVASPVSAGRL